MYKKGITGNKYSISWICCFAACT